VDSSTNHPTPIRDLSAPWTFRGGSDPNQIWLRLTTGVGIPCPPTHTGSRPANAGISSSYVQSLARVAPWQPGGDSTGLGSGPICFGAASICARGDVRAVPHADQPHRHLSWRRFLSRRRMRVGAYPHGLFVSRNLTSDDETGVGKWTEAQIVNALRNGRAPDRLLNLWWYAVVLSPLPYRR